MQLTRTEVPLDRLTDRRIMHANRLRVRTFFASHEAVARGAFAYALQTEGETVGYALVASMKPVSALAGRLHEFDLAPEYEFALSQVPGLLRVDAMHARSDDALAVRLGNLMNMNSKPIAPIFEATDEIAMRPQPGLSVSFVPPDRLDRMRGTYAQMGGSPADLDGCEVYALGRGDETVGFARVQPQPAAEYVALYPTIKPDLRGKGLGRFLVGSMVRRLQDQHRRVLATISYDQTDAIFFFRAIGFEAVAEHLLFTRR